VSNFVELAAAAHLLDQVRASLDRSVVACAVGPVTAARLRSSGLACNPIEPSRPRLGAMVRALATALGARSSVLRLGGHEVLVQGRLVSARASQPVLLTDREREVLKVLSRRPGAVVSKQTLLAQVWDADTDPHVVEVTIGRLRRRLADAGLRVETVVRRGYRLVSE
jgi:uroporphyrinogen-III synthase